MRLCRLPILLNVALLMLTAACDNEPPLPVLQPNPASMPAPPVLADQATAAPTIKAPHGGRLRPMPDNRGYVEWVVDAGRLYLVDAAAAPAKGAESIVLTIQTPTGPQQLPLTPCEEAGFEGACWTNPAPELKNEDTLGVVRFLLDGQPIRVVLGTQPSPADAGLPSLPAIETRANP